MKDTLINFIFEHWAAISALFYELIVRLFPTKVNASILDAVFKLIRVLIPNRQKTGGTFLFIFALLSVSVFAQNNGNFKSVRLRSGSTESGTYNLNGTIIYNHQTNLFRGYQNGTWVNLGGGSGGGITNSSPLNELPNTIDGGGNLGPSGITFSTSNSWGLGAPTNGSLGDRNFFAQGTQANLNIALTSKGTGGINIVGRLNTGILTDRPAINIPSIPATPGTLANGDMWATVTDFLVYRTGASNFFMMGSSVPGANRIPFHTSPNGIMNSNAAFTFNGTTFNTPNVVSSGRITAVSTAAAPGVNVGSVAATTSTVFNAGDLWWNSTNNMLMQNTASSSFGMPRIDQAGGLLSNTALTFATSDGVGIRSDNEFTYNVTLNRISMQNIGSAATTNYGDALIQANSNSTAFTGTFQFVMANGNATQVTGQSLQIAGGLAHTTGNNNGGDIILTGGTNNGTGRRGQIILLNLPTSPAGLPSGSVWNNAGVLNIVP